jgi:hypothetical protein
MWSSTIRPREGQVEADLDPGPARCQTARHVRTARRPGAGSASHPGIGAFMKLFLR